MSEAFKGKQGRSCVSCVEGYDHVCDFLRAERRLWIAGNVAKKAKAELEECVQNAQKEPSAGAAAAAKPAALPAFLQTSTVAALYGSGQETSADGKGQADMPAKSEAS